MQRVLARLIATFRRLRSNKNVNSDVDAELEVRGSENKQITNAASDPGLNKLCVSHTY